MSRFERKILLVLGLTVAMALGGSLFLAQSALREAYQVGVNPQFGAELTQGVEARRGQLMALRSDSEHLADAIKWALQSELQRNARPRALEGLLDRLVRQYPNIRSIAVIDESGETLVFAERTVGAADEPMRATTREREVEVGRRRYIVEVEVVVPAAYFERLQQAGEVAEVYSRLQQQSASVSDVYVWVFGSLVFLVIVVAFVVGAVLSRRVTHRVTVLAEATRRVGAGDLTVTLPTGSTDEVTELTQAFNDMVRDLRESRARIEYLQRIGAWQEFARRLAHEIKNPLTPIQLAAQEMEQTYQGADEDFREKLQHARDIIEEEVATLRRLVGEFSAFAKLPRAHLSPADLCDLVQAIEDSVPAILDDVGDDHPATVEVRITCATKPMPVRMDPMMLKRGVDNLLRNAIEAVNAAYPEGGGVVTLDARPSEGKAVIEVSDNGPGIPEADWERVFDPYYTTKSEGTGLGLPIVKKVVLEHQGGVRVTRAAGGGARFRIDLPLRASP